MKFPVRRCILGAFGNVVSARLRLPILLSVSVGSVGNSAGEPFGTAGRRFQAVLRPAAALRSTSVEYRNLAGTLAHVALIVLRDSDGMPVNAETRHSRGIIAAIYKIIASMSYRPMLC